MSDELDAEEMELLSQYDGLSEGSDIDVAAICDLDEFYSLDADMQQVDPLDLDQIRSIEERSSAASTDDDDNDDDDLPSPPVVTHQEGWTTNPEDFTTYDNMPEFNGRGGSNCTVHQDSPSEKYFNQYFDDVVWDHLVKETNDYSDHLRENTPPSPGSRRWDPVTRADVKAFVGLCFAMGVLQLPDRADYFRRIKWLFATNFGEVMSRDRFFQIWRYFHLNPVEQPLPLVRDRLHKLRFLITHLNQNFSEKYQCHGTASIDESMIKFKGRLAWTQYMPAKPIKWGIKVWALAESTTGYMMRFQIYTGKEGQQGNPQPHGLAHRVVTDLMEGYDNSNIRVFMDNFYSSVPLFKELSQRGIGATGTVRANRKHLPRELLPKTAGPMEKHAFKTAQWNDLSYCIWQDTKRVCVLSNQHDPTALGSVRRRSGQPVQRDVEVPKMLDDYQRHMKGVDLCDQMIGYYMINHRSKKWWRRAFFYLMMASAHNAYVLAKNLHGNVIKKKWPGFKGFVEDLALDLVQQLRACRATPLPPAVTYRNTPALPNTVGHTMKKRTDGMYKVCLVCKRNGQSRKTTLNYCRECNMPVHCKCWPRHVQQP